MIRNRLDPDDVPLTIHYTEQEWAGVCSWLENSDPKPIERFMDLCVNDDPNEFVKQLAESPMLAEIAQRCILLVINEALLRIHNRRNSGD